MSTLTVFNDQQPSQALQHSQDPMQMALLLQAQGIGFEQWPLAATISTGSSSEEVLMAYRSEIDRLQQQEGYQAVDVVSLTANHPDKVALRAKFLQEHIHNEDEVRFFVAGQGLFSVHKADKVYEIHCQAGDLIRVPAHTRHWFDMGPNPNFIAIRLFNNPAGWVAHFTGSLIADGFSRLQN